MTTIRLTFPWGRFYATPWGLNASRLREPEWPPSPWRLLRALLSAWFKAHPGQVPSVGCVELIEALGRDLPEIGTGKVSFGHTVHWQPNYGQASAEDKADATYKNTRHENHFAAVSGAVFMRWPNLKLSPELRRILQALLVELSYFGRAESLCHAELSDTEPSVRDIGWCLPRNGRKISATCRDVFCPNPADFRFTDLWSRRAANLAPDSLDAPPHLVETLLSSDMKADGGAWFSYQMPHGWPQEWVVRTPRTATPRTARPSRNAAPTAGPKVAHYLCFSLQCRVPLLPKFIVPLSERFRAAAIKHLCRVHGDGTPSFALSGHAIDRPKDTVGDHQHAFYLPMAARDDPNGFLSDLHVWCPYGFTREETEIFLRVQRLDWGSGKYPVRPVLTAMAKEVPRDAPFSVGCTESKLWRSRSPFVPPRYFYRRNGDKVTLKDKDRPERQLAECLKAAGVTTAGEIRLIGVSESGLAASRLQWDIVRVPALEESLAAEGMSLPVHRNSSENMHERERRIGLFFEILFEKPTVLPLPTFGHSNHFGLGLFVPAS